MKTTIATVIKTGNSFALRVPKSYAERNRLRLGSKVSLPDPQTYGGTLADLDAKLSASVKKDKIPAWDSISNPSKWQRNERQNWS